MANCVQNNLWKFCKKILNCTENNDICLRGSFLLPHTVHSTNYILLTQMFDICCTTLNVNVFNCLHDTHWFHLIVHFQLHTTILREFPSEYLMSTKLTRHHHHIITSHGLNARWRPMPASPSSVSCFGPVLSGSVAADFHRITPQYRLSTLCVGGLSCSCRPSSQKAIF